MNTRRTLLVGLGLAAMIGAGALAARAYVLSGYRWPGSSPVIPFYISTSLQGNIPYDGTFQEAVDAIVRGADQWVVIDPANPSAIPISNFKFQYMGLTSLTAATDDGVNIVTFKAGPAPVPPGGGGNAGAWAQWYWTNFVNHGFDITLYSENSAGVPIQWSVQSLWYWDTDLQSLSAHEFGHIVGLDHSNYATPVMGTSCLGPGCTENSTLTYDDIAGIQALYGVTVPPPTTYCTGKPNSCGGQTPAISFSGIPGVSKAIARESFTITGDRARKGKLGLLMYSPNGRAAQPFHGGTLCVSAVGRKRGPAVMSSNQGRGITCIATFSVDWNAFARGDLGGNPGAFLMQPGQVVNVQWWGRDSQSSGSYLSDALEYTVAP